MSSPSQSKRRTGFTLVELMVVIAIIALLIALAMPQLAKARAQASKSVCGTRVHALGIALAVYLAQNGDSVPLNGVMLPKEGTPAMYDPSKSPGVTPTFIAQSRTNPDQRRIEFGALWPYMNGPALPLGTTIDTVSTNPVPLPSAAIAKAFICPNDPGMLRTYVGTNGNNNVKPLWLDSSSGVPRVKAGSADGTAGCAPGYWSYSVNSVLNPLGRFRDRFTTDQLPWSDPLKFFNLKATFDFITFVEEDNNSLFNDEVMDAPAYSEGDQLTNRHNGGGNVGFADGHVEYFTQSVFDNPPSAIKNQQYVQHTEAMQSEITRKFFPDRGDFALQNQ